MKLLKKIILSICVTAFVLFFVGEIGLNKSMAYAETTTLKASVSLVENVPTGLFGTWRVAAVLKTTDSPDVFRPKSVDLWNLSKNNNVMNLNNPFTGATADLAVEFVRGNVIKFTKVGSSGDKKLTDTVEITLSGGKFTGINRLILQTVSESNGQIIRTQSAEYVLVGEKISGNSVLEK